MTRSNGFAVEIFLQRAPHRVRATCASLKDLWTPAYWVASATSNSY
ncbi:hypothetical protein [Longivirga aurantiaca]|uniref:Uncharacterized protein n=1 Tax=Longivirga aurantiaca TaxID=1837743 RepID=A0ABW1T5E0_9ACTN